MDRYLNRDLDSKARAKDLLDRLNVKEKVGQLNQSLYGFRSFDLEDGEAKLTEEFHAACKEFGGLGTLYGLYRADPWTERSFDNGLDRRQMVSLYNEVQEAVMSASRFKIPALFSQEAPHGPNQLDGYLLPVNLAAGAAFNPELYQKACKVAGEELRESGVHLALVAMLDVLRDPRWGRSEECYSEDPYLSSLYAAAGTKGYMEGGTDVVAKHFAAQGEGTGGVNASSARIGERELREIHVPPMAAAAKAGAMGVMAAYNEIDGVFCHANPWLLKTLLRDELGFKGIVMADGIAIDNLNLVTGDVVESAKLALESGVDMSLWDEAFTRLEEAVERHPDLLERLDEACLRILELKFSSGLFDNPLLKIDEVKIYDVNEHPEALDLARESIVLLKNENSVLPLNEDEIKTLAVIGPHVRDIYTLCGDYSPYLDPKRYSSIADRLAERATVLVEEGSGIRNRNPEALEHAKELASQADAVVLTLGGSSSRFGESVFMANGALAGTVGDVDCGEGVDVGDISLSPAQLELFDLMQKVTTEKSIPLIVVVIGGRPYAIPEVAEHADALLYSFYPGPDGGLAIADVLYGLAPSGRLPVTLPRSTAQLPIHYNHKTSYKPRYADQEATPLFEFGAGITYSTFELESAELSKDEIRADETVMLSVKMKNTGLVDAAAVPQLYTRRGRSTVVPRIRELKAFEKVFIPAGETKTIELTLAADDLKIWSLNKTWELETGTVKLDLRDSGESLWTSELKVKA